MKKSYVMNAQNINMYVDVHITYKVCTNLPFMLPVRFLVNSRWSVVKSGESQKLHVDFPLCWGGWVTLNPMLLKGQLTSVIKDWKEE